MNRWKKGLRIALSNDVFQSEVALYIETEAYKSLWP